MGRPYLLFDARNILYRAIYACGETGQSRTVARTVEIMADCVTKFKPSRAAIFWDAPSESIWRRKVYPKYKDRSGQRDWAREELARHEPIVRELMPVLGLLQFAKNGAEADDLIYAACRVLHPQETVIISSDGDYAQIVYRMPTVKLYDHRADKTTITEQLDYDPAVQKALAGDKSDTIDGYLGIGPVKSADLARSITDLNMFLEHRGAAEFIRNLLLVDLSMCPDLLKNQVYVQRGLSRSTTFNRMAVYDLARTHKLTSLVEKYDRAVTPFKLMAE